MRLLLQQPPSPFRHHRLRQTPLQRSSTVTARVDHHIAAVTGASIEPQSVAWIRNTPGAVAVICRKDQPGGLGPAHQTVARIVGTPIGDPPTLALEVLPPATTPEHDSQLVERVTDYLSTVAEASKRQIAETVKARQQDVRAVLQHLADRGEISRRDGPRGAHLYSLTATASHRVPDAVKGANSPGRTRDAVNVTECAGPPDCLSGCNPNFLTQLAATGLLVLVGAV